MTDGQVVSLAALGLRDPYRRFSAAEVDALREALRGETGTVGYVCWGRAGVGAGAPARPGAIPGWWWSPTTST